MKLKTYQKYLITQFGKKNFEVCMVFFCLIFILNIFEEISFLKNTDANFLYPLLLQRLVDFYLCNLEIFYLLNS